MNMQIEDMPFTQGIGIESECKMFSLPPIMKKSFTALLDFSKTRNLEIEHVYTKYENLDFEELCTMGPLKMFFDMFTRKWNFHCGLSIKSAADKTGDEQVRFYDYPAQKVATMIHKGPYHKVGATYKKLYSDLKEQDLKAGNTCFEVYFNDPRETRPSDLETKILVPLV